MQQADRDATRRAFSKPAVFAVLDKGLALKQELTAARLRELLNYDPETGLFTWRVTRRGTARVGSQAGNVRPPKMYRYICVEGRHYKAGRLAWFYVYGAWPSQQIDHADGDRLNDAIKNLRDCSNAENSQNRGMRSDNTSGYPGVTWNKARRKWQAQVKADGANHNAGLFADRAVAFEAYLCKKRQLHSFQPAPRA